MFAVLVVGVLIRLAPAVGRSEGGDASRPTPTRTTNTSTTSTIRRRLLLLLRYAPSLGLLLLPTPGSPIVIEKFGQHGNRRTLLGTDAFGLLLPHGGQ